jgi:hypothetical protein
MEEFCFLLRNFREANILDRVSYCQILDGLFSM